MSSLPDLPLLHDGDAFVITLEGVSPRCVRIVRIIRYPNNENGDGFDTSFHDLPPEAKHAVTRQINRRHVGKTIRTT